MVFASTVAELFKQGAVVRGRAEVDKAGRRLVKADGTADAGQSTTASKGVGGCEVSHQDLLGHVVRYVYLPVWRAAR